MTNSFKYQEFADILDQEYYPKYPESRFKLHASIIDEYVNTAKPATDKPKLILMAGCYGSGKSHTISHLKNTNMFNIDDFVYIDQDKIRFKIPEINQYISDDPWTAGEKTQIESGYLSEIIQRKILSMGSNLIVDGSLHDDKWYSQVFIPYIRKSYPKYEIAIFYVKADWTNVLERCWDRCEKTKRCIPLRKLKTIYHKIPNSVNNLSKLVDVVVEIDNNIKPDIIKNSTIQQID